MGEKEERKQENTEEKGRRERESPRMCKCSKVTGCKRTSEQFHSASSNNHMSENSRSAVSFKNETLKCEYDQTCVG